MVIKLPMRKTRKWTPPRCLGPTRASCAPVAGGGQGPGGAAGRKGAARCGRQPEGSHSRARAAPRAPRGSRGSRGVCKVPKEKTHSSRCHKTALLRARPLRFGYEANSHGRGSPQTAPPLLRALPLPRGPQAPPHPLLVPLHTAGFGLPVERDSPGGGSRGPMKRGFRLASDPRA